MATVLKGIKRGKGGGLTKTDQGWVYRENKTAVILSNIQNESPYVVCTTSGLPRVGIDRLSPSGAVCTGITPKQDAVSPYVWFAEIEYSTETSKQDTGSDPNPTTWIPLYAGKIETYPEVMYQDQDSPPKPYLNSAKSKFPEPLIVNRPVIVYDFYQYEDGSSLTDVQIGDRNDTINAGSISRGFGAQTLKCTITDFERGYFFGYDAVRIHYSIAYKKNKWLNIPLDMGYEYFVTDGTGAKKKLTSDSIVALNSDGTKRADDAAPLTLEFKQFREISFSFLR